MYDIVTVGSNTVDVFVRCKGGETLKHEEHVDVCFALGTKILVRDIFQSTGGGGTNCAVAFARLGFKTGYVGKVGDDGHGHIVCDMLRDDCVDLLGARGEGKTGYSVILCGLAKDRTILAYKGINDELKWKDVKDFDTKALYFSSMLDKSLKTAKKLLANHDVPWAFNPSNYLAKKGFQKLSAFVDGASLLVMNKEEARAITGSNAKVDRLLKELQSHAKHAVITDGKRGAYGYDGKKKYTLVPYDVKVVETTGAGDSFAAGTFAGLRKTGDLRVAMQWGYAEAASVLRAIGAKNNLLTHKQLRSELSARKAKVKVERL